MVAFRFYQLTNLLTIPIYPTITPNNGVAQIINSTAVQPSNHSRVATHRVHSPILIFFTPESTMIYDLSPYAGQGGQQAVGITNKPISGGLEAVGPSWPEIVAGADSAVYFFALGTADSFTVELNGYGAPGGSDGVPRQ